MESVEDKAPLMTTSFSKLRCKYSVLLHLHKNVYTVLHSYIGGKKISWQRHWGLGAHQVTLSHLSYSKILIIILQMIVKIRIQKIGQIPHATKEQRRVN